MLDALLACYQDTPIVDRAIAQVRAQAATQTTNHQAELDTIAAELRRIHRAIDRYDTAVENGTLSEQQCGQRVAKLQAQRDQLQARQAELQAEAHAAQFTTPDTELLAELGSQVALAMRTGTIPTLKELLKALVLGIRVESRVAIHPTFRVPLKGDDAPSRTPRGGVSPHSHTVRDMSAHHLTFANPNTADLR